VAVTKLIPVKWWRGPTKPKGRGHAAAKIKEKWTQSWGGGVRQKGREHAAAKIKGNGHCRERGWSNKRKWPIKKE